MSSFIMEERKTRLKKVKKRSNLRTLMADKKKRYLIMFAMMIPFIIAIGIFGSIVFREVKTLKDLAGGGQVETKKENIVENMNYILRDNPTDLQKDLFKQLKTAAEDGIIQTEEGEVEADDAAIAELVAKNYVADFYTWTNKRGQYDMGGFYYIYDGEFINGDHYKENLFLKARDGFYKYISYYGNLYGKENLIEVDSVEVTNCKKMSTPYVISEHDSYKQDEQGEWYDYRIDRSYDCYVVSLKWTYKPNEKMNVNQFGNSINLAVIKRNGRFEIVEASEKTINARTGSETNSTTETTETSEETSTTAAE